MRLKYQLFLTLLLVSALLVTLMALINSWSFDRGFVAYINATERQRLAPLVDELAAGYAREGGWGWIASDRAAWKALFDKHVGPAPRPSNTGRQRASPDPGDTPYWPPESQARLNGDNGPPPERLPGDDGAAQAGAQRREGATLTLDSQLLLADDGHHLLIGRLRDNQQVHWQPIRVDDRPVGFLGHREKQALPGQLDQAFAAQQRRVFVYAALAMTLLSALLAVTLADRLARPLLEINNTVRRISRGEYSQRVPDARGDELGDLSRSINTLAMTLEKNLDARRQWLAEISHELRTPVAVLQSELEAIEDGVNRPDTKAIASLHAETLRLARLIDDLHDLTLSDVGALDYHFERVDIAQVMTTRIDAARHATEEANLSTTTSFPPIPVFIEGDTQRLGQLVDNLLQNSLRYTEAGGQIHIALWRDDNQVIMDWSDSAPGVSSEQLSLLFEPLYRTDDSRSRQGGGAGLGLTIVQRIVEAHRGTITARHSPLGGLSFNIEMPEFERGSTKGSTQVPATGSTKGSAKGFTKGSAGGAL